MRGEWPLILGDDVTIGHSVTLHGCTIESRCLIGMGAVILNGVTIGAGSIVAAGTHLPPRTWRPSGRLGIGPPRKKRPGLPPSRQGSSTSSPPRPVRASKHY